MMESSEASRVSSALKQCQDIQHMIDITSQHLERLRSTFSNAGDELTMQEIRTLEGKLIKQFSEQLSVKYGLGAHGADLVYFPSLSQWLVVVGVSSETNDAIKSRVKSLEELKDKTECELKRILITSSRVSPRQIPEDLRRLCRSLLNLRKYTDALMYGHKMYGPSQDPSKLELHWDSWDSVSMSRDLPAVSPKHDTKTCRDDLLRSVPMRLSSGAGGRGHGGHGHDHGHGQGSDSAASSLSSSSSVPPPSPGLMSYDGNTTNTGARSSLITPPATPPWAAVVTKPGAVSTPADKITGNMISKSKSQEADLGNRLEETVLPGHVLDGGDQETVGSSGYSSSSEAPGQTNTSSSSASGGRVRLHSSDPESGQEMCPSVPSPIASPKSPSNSKQLSVPKSPRTPGAGARIMTHTIAHRFKKTYMPAKCDYCQENIFPPLGLKCKECKFRCHTHCEKMVPPSCGLPNEFLECFLNHLTNKNSPSQPRHQPPLIQVDTKLFPVKIILFPLLIRPHMTPAPAAATVPLPLVLK